MSGLAARDEVIRRTERFIAYLRAAVIGFNIVTYLALGAHGERHTAALAVCIVAGLYSILTLFDDPLRWMSPMQSAVMTTIGDNVLIALWIWATGGFNSPYFPLFYAEAAASIGRFGARTGGIAAVGSALAYAVVLLVDGGPFFDSLVRVAYTGFIGAFVGYVVSLTRETEREMSVAKSRAETLEQLDDMRTAFVSTVSHELRTPLTAVQGAATTLQRMGGSMSDEEKARMIDILARQSERLASLIEDMISLGLAEKGRLALSPEPTDLLRVVHDEVEAFERDAPQPVVLIPVVGTVEASCDPRGIGEAVSKLLSNAAKFSPPGAPITVAIENHGAEIHIKVIDQGIGIAPEDQQMIFERFRQLDMSHTRPAEGAGIGLSIVRTILRLHGGDVIVSSTPGEGSTFTLILPRTPVSDGLMQTRSA